MMYVKGEWGQVENSKERELIQKVSTILGYDVQFELLNIIIEKLVLRIEELESGKPAWMK